MIVILKREDLQPEARELDAEELHLYHTELSPEVIQQADLIVFVEGEELKFLKQFPGIESRESFDLLQRYIVSKAPLSKERRPWSLGPGRHRKPRN